MKQFKILSVLTVLIVLFGCAQETPDADNTINKEEISNELAKIWDDYLVAWKSGDKETCMNYLTSEDYLNLPSVDATQDYQETEEMFQNVFENNIIESANYKQTEVFVHADMAYEFGKLDQVWISKVSGDTMQFFNRCISVWKKMEDESWKLHRWMAQ